MNYQVRQYLVNELSQVTQLTEAQLTKLYDDFMIKSGNTELLRELDDERLSRQSAETEIQELKKQLAELKKQVSTSAGGSTHAISPRGSPRSSPRSSPRGTSSAATTPGGRSVSAGSDAKLEGVHLWRSLFDRLDANNDGTLSEAELGELIQMIYMVRGETVTKEKVDAGAKEAIAVMAEGTGHINFTQLQRFASTRSDLFGDLMRWQRLFARYVEGVGPNGGVRFKGMQQFLWDVLRERGDTESATDEWVFTQATQGMKEMDTNGDGSICFSEFVKYGRNHLNMFAGLLGWRDVFDKYDSDKNGQLDKDELATCVEDILTNVSGMHGTTPTIGEIKVKTDKAFKAILKDPKGRGGVTFEEFVAYAEQPKSEFGQLFH